MVNVIGSHVRQKLVTMLGEHEAALIAAQVLREAGLQRAHSPQDRFRFGEFLARRGGVYAVLGRSIQTQALLHGAHLIPE
jgi:hypothetical protein